MVYKVASCANRIHAQQRRPRSGNRHLVGPHIGGEQVPRHAVDVEGNNSRQSRPQVVNLQRPGTQVRSGSQAKGGIDENRVDCAADGFPGGQIANLIRGPRSTPGPDIVPRGEEIIVVGRKSRRNSIHHIGIPPAPVRQDVVFDINVAAAGDVERLTGRAGVGNIDAVVVDVLIV